MKELNMAIYTGKDGENKVTLTAGFETHEEAVEFQHGMAVLCHNFSKSKSPTKWGWRLRVFEM